MSVSKIEERVAHIIDHHLDSLEAARALLADPGFQGYMEQKAANDMVRELRRRHVCPTCGADA